MSGLVLAVAAGLTGAHRAHYTSWPWDGEPARLHWCDRTYERGPSRTLESEAEIVGDAELYPVFRAPPVVGDEVFTALRPAKVRGAKRNSQTCGSLLHMRVGEDRYLTYALLGGP